MSFVITSFLTDGFKSGFKESLLFYRVIVTTIMVVNTGSASPSLAHPFTVQDISIGIPNWWRKCGHEPTSTGFYGSHPWCLAESKLG
jgi:hypothetical protein